jgi:glutathione S-transferase
MAESAKLTLYHIAPSRSSIVLWMLEEVGEPYNLRVLDARKDEQRGPAYLAINPMGKVPALAHDGVIVTEAAAVCAYLADAFPQAGLSVPIGDPRRGTYLRWLFFAPGSLEPAIIDRVLERPAGPRGALGYGDFETTMDVVASALEQGPWLLGEQFTAADVVLGSALRWGLMTKKVPERAEIMAYVGRMERRPAARRAIQKDTELSAKKA